jgi:hypothetical protein
MENALMEDALQASVATASFEEQLRLDDLIRLRQHAVAYDYNIKCGVPYDGDCIFTSVCILESQTKHLTNFLHLARPVFCRAVVKGSMLPFFLAMTLVVI